MVTLTQEEANLLLNELEYAKCRMEWEYTQDRFEDKELSFAISNLRKQIVFLYGRMREEGKNND